jgi:RNA 2',3'-cyclic 3'-phosphodiesterase
MSGKEESWRLFIAIELPAPLRRRITEHIDHLRRKVPDARASWIREANLHLTLKFLGDTQVSKVESVSCAVERAALTSPPFEISVGGCGAFPPRGNPRVLWIGIDPETSDLATLHKALEEECSRLGFEREQRAFHPHLTIARVRQPEGARELAERHVESGFAPEAVPIRDVCLIRSELRSEGSRYTIIARHRFR